MIRALMIVPVASDHGEVEVPAGDPGRAAVELCVQKSEGMGMRTFDSALYHLYQDGKISLEETLKNADAENNLRLRIELDAKGKGKGSEDTFSGLSLLAEPEEEDEDEEEYPDGPPIFATAPMPKKNK